MLRDGRGGTWWGGGGSSSALMQEGRKQVQQNIYFLCRIMEAGDCCRWSDTTRAHECVLTSADKDRKHGPVLPNRQSCTCCSIVTVFMWCVGPLWGLSSKDASEVKERYCQMRPVSANAGDNSGWPWLFNSHSNSKYWNSLEVAMATHAEAAERCVCDLPFHQHK